MRIKDIKTGRFIQTLKNKECKYCGKVFHPFNELSKYCSKKCQAKVMVAEKNLNWKGGKRIKIICKNCGRAFFTYNRIKSRQFCSKKCYSNWQSLNVRKDKHPMWGKTHLKKAREKMSEIKKGKCFSAEHRKKISLGNIKRWDKVGRKIYKRYIHLTHTPEYCEWRDMVFKRDNYVCQDCGESNCYLQAHHILSWAKYPDKRFEIDNGRTLCKECHKFTPNYTNRKVSSYG